MARRLAATALILLGLEPAAAAGERELADAVDRIRGMDGVHTVLVQFGGELVAERGDADRPHNVKSLSKSILSAAAGTAIGEGLIAGLDEPVHELLPEAIDWRNEPAKRDIRLRHLLSMTAGLATTSHQHYGAWVSSDDWVRAALSRPVVAEPGEQFIYSTGNSHLVSAALARASGGSTRDYVDREVLEPIGAEIVAWDRSPQGIHMGGNNVSVTARGLVAFGQLYLDEGRADGRQIVPADWVTSSTRVHADGWPDRYGQYGYLWWIRPSGAFMAVGYGGQFLYVDPKHRAVVVVLSSHKGKGADWDRRLIGLLENELIPALGRLNRAHPIRSVSRLGRSASAPLGGLPSDNRARPCTAPVSLRTGASVPCP